MLIIMQGRVEAVYGIVMKMTLHAFLVFLPWLMDTSKQQFEFKQGILKNVREKIAVVHNNQLQHGDLQNIFVGLDKAMVVV